MRHLSDMLPWLTIVLFITGLCNLHRLGQPGYIVGDPLSEHIVDCKTCSNPVLPADACPVGMHIQYERTKLLLHPGVTR